jgi:hypothetical protein
MHPSLRHFVRHYVEMVIAMFLGMAVLGLPAEWALAALGTSTNELEADAPAVMLLLMATIMTVPMVGWMRYRGHGWRPSAEMAASMYLPSFAAIGLLAADASTLTGAMVLEHAVMLPAMLVAMLLRLDEYTGAHHHQVGSAQEATA